SRLVSWARRCGSETDETLTLPSKADLSDVRLLSKTTQLRDVIVQAPDIYAKGDTLVFNVERYATAKDNAIIDIIKRLPGIKVEKDGTIKYQGKPINKFYIDGNDFIGGQYGLATNNISHKDVKSVEVLENHQPVKALEGIEFPEEAGINLKLNESARGRWVGVAKVAAGAQPLLASGSLYAMRIAKKIQNMITLKGDNTGWNPANEIQDHDFNDMFSAGYNQDLWPGYISADNAGAPLSEKRTRDNISWLANAISAWKKGDTSMRLKVNYIGDRLDYASGVTTDYFSPEIPAFVQNNTLRTQSHDLSAQFFSQINKRGYYLKDKFEVSGCLQRASSEISGPYELDPLILRKILMAKNDLKLVKRNEKRLFSLISRNSFRYQPDRLLIAGKGTKMQTVGTTDLRSTTETQIGRIMRFWKYYATAGMDIDYHRMNTALTGMGSFDNTGIHHAFLSDIHATPQVDFNRRGWRVSFRMPMKWLHHSVAGSHNYVNLSPGINIHRQLTAKSELSASAAYRLGSPQAYLNIDVPILADYRNLFIGRNTGKYSGDMSVSASYRYRNPIKALFINASAGYNYQRSSQMANQLFTGDYIISTFSDRLHSTRSWQLGGGFSKGLGHSKIVVGADANVSAVSASSMRDNDVIPFRQQTATVKPYFKGSILRWLSANYEAEYSYSQLRINEESNKNISLRQAIFITVSPHDALQLTAGTEQYLTRFPEGNTANLILIDASAMWRISSKVTLSLSANNLLGKRQYRYVTYGTLSRSEHTFRIRPRNLLAAVQLRF
ncbi:MAG: hypothetical protein K2M12_09545, partial [Muribaculaceae bacterium]|nr:hypothetical protein [Muribaculaceae bacterium]